MNDFGEWMVRHPRQVGTFFAVLYGVLAYELFRFGAAYGAVQAVRAEAARAASEALGG